MKTIFDVGMYDASDTRYYLEEGYKVIAVEANPALAKRAERILSDYIRTGQLQIVNAAISSDNSNIELTVCGDNLGASSMYKDTLVHKAPIGSFTVPGITTQEIFAKFGVPYYLKIDIEGADKLCVRSLSAGTRPQYLSFEMGDDFEELFDHVASVGFTKFKVINQCNFRELSNENSFSERLVRKLIRLSGYTEPQYARRGGRYFKLGQSSGPAPWNSDGQWSSRQELLRKWGQAKPSKPENVWYDLHAM